MKQMILALLAVVVIVGCSKNNSSTTPPAPSANTILLTQKDWLRTKYEYKQASATTWIDGTSSIPACKMDDHVVFRTDGTYEDNEGATRCSAGDPFIVESGTWKFAQNETMVILTPAGSTSKDAFVEILTGTTLVFTSTASVSGTLYNRRESYGH